MDDIKKNELKIKAIEALSKGQGYTTLLKKAGVASGVTRKEIVTLEPNTALKIAMENLGVNEDYIALKILQCFEARNIKVNAKGEVVHESPDYKVILQAVEMYGQICGYFKGNEKMSGDKHLHLHGKTTEELDGLLRAAQAREDKEAS